MGQTGPDSVECNRGAVTDLDFDPPTADMLCFPGALSLDRQGNLYVSDHPLEHEGNFRLLVFLKDQFSTNNSTAIYAPPAYKVFDRHGLPGHNLGAGHTEFLAVIDKSGESGPLRASTFETAFDSQNTMVVGYNMYAGSRFVGVYDYPLGVDTEPTSYLNDFWSMPYAATFDDKDNLYVGDLNRARVLVYWNPLNTPAQPSTPQVDITDAPIPEYQATIGSVNPQPPYCVIRDSSSAYEQTLEFVVDGISESGQSELQIRKVGSTFLRAVKVRPQFGENEEARIRLDRGELWKDLWPLYEKVTMTARLIEPDGQAVTNWSPAFLLANDVESCGIALPTPTPTPAPTQVPTAAPTYTPVPTATATLVPTATLAPEPTTTSTPAPAETYTPEPTARAIATPTREPATATLAPESTTTHTPVPAESHTPDSTATAIATPTPGPTTAPTPGSTPSPTSTGESVLTESDEVNGGFPAWAVVVIVIGAAAGAVLVVFVQRRRR